MPQYGMIDNEKGFIISEKDFERVVKTSLNGKIIYFIPSRPIISDLSMEDLIKDFKTKDDICGILGVSRGCINGRLKKKYNTCDLSEIRMILNK